MERLKENVYVKELDKLSKQIRIVGFIVKVGAIIFGSFLLYTILTRCCN